jgi:transposase
MNGNLPVIEPRCSQRQDALSRFRRRQRGSGAKFKAVATDMSSACHAEVVKNLPNARQVFDRFHVTKLMNNKLTQLRRDVQSEAETMDRKVLKGLRWLLLKHPEILDQSKNGRVRLQEALDLNRSLSVAYSLKEDLSQIWPQQTGAAAARFLTDWCRRARASGIRVTSSPARKRNSLDATPSTPGPSLPRPHFVVSTMPQVSDWGLLN